MAAEATAANLAKEGTYAGASAITTAGAAIKAFALANPIGLAAVGGIVVGVLGYRLLVHDDQEGEAAEATDTEQAEEAPAS